MKKVLLAFVLAVLATVDSAPIAPSGPQVAPRFYVPAQPDPNRPLLAPRFYVPIQVDPPTSLLS